MNTRRRIVTRTSAAPVTRILRTRRKVEPVDASGEVVAIGATDSFSIDLLKKSPGSMNAFRAGEYLHVSDLLGKCLRKIALSERYSARMPNEMLHESMAVTFAQGTAIHDHLKARYAKGHPDKMFGEWSCNCGSLRTNPCTLTEASKKKCGVCGGTPVKYHELELRDPDIGVIGSPDVTFYLREFPVFYPLEIKSMNHEEWKEIARPKPDHLLQVLFYWMLLRKLGYPVPDQISILYVTKGFLFKTPYKEFIVRPADQIHRLDPYIEEAMVLKKAKDGGALPCRTRCPSPECSEAKGCHVVNLCFQQP